MKRFLAITLLWLGVYLGWRFGMPYFDAKSEQDECAFGPVSNSRYKELLAEAQKRQLGSWQALKGTNLDKGLQLQTRIAELSQGMTSIYERLAAMHAVMRATGAYFFSVESDPYRLFSAEGIDKRPYNAPTAIMFSYSAHSNYVGGFQIFFPESDITVGLPIFIGSDAEVRSDLARPPQLGEFYVSLRYPPSLEAALTGFATNLWRTRGQSAGCPPVPNKRWAEEFDQWANFKRQESH